MKVNAISFTNYKLWIDIYNKCDMDFFSYLLMNLIVNKNEDIYLDDVRKDLELADKIAYLFENSFYNLFDNKLIEGNDDYLSCKLSELRLTKLGEECYASKQLYIYSGEEYKEVCISPVDDSVKAIVNDVDYTKSVVLNKVNDVSRVEKIINDNLKKVFPTYKDVRVVINRMESDVYQEMFDISELADFGIKDNFKYYDCESRNVLDDGCELSLVSDDVKGVDYSDNLYDFVGTIGKSKYGFNYYIVADVPYIKKFKLK